MAGTVRYSLRVDKVLQDGTAPVDLIYQVKGQRKYFRTDVKLFPQLWNAKEQVAIYLTKKEWKKEKPEYDFDLLPSLKDVEDHNKALQKITNKVRKIEQRFELDEIAYSSEMVIERLKDENKAVTKKEADKNVVFEFMQDYVDSHKNTREASSLSVYRSVKNYLQKFSEETGRKVTFQNLDYNFFQAFQNYLLKDKVNNKGVKVSGLKNTSVAKHLSTVKTFLNYARKQGVDVSMRYKDFTIKRESLEVIALTNDEFEKVFAMDLEDDKRLAAIRDVFCFSCVTGLRDSDLRMLRREHIKKDEIEFTVKKTKRKLSIPLNDYSRFILNKYKDNLKPLPVVSNQNANYAIKALCKRAEINEPVEIVRYRGIKREATVYPKHELITIHVGRKTFATLSLEKGMSAEEVMEVGGWTDYKSFKRYVNITKQRKKVVMVKAWGNDNISKLKAV